MSSVHNAPSVPAKPTTLSSKSSSAARAKSSSTKPKDASNALSATRPTKDSNSNSSRNSNSNDVPSQTHRLSLKGSARLVAEFFQFSIHTILFQRGVYPAEDFTAVKKYGLNMLVSADDQVKAYVRKIMGQLDRWMADGKISKLVVVITDKDTGENVERWQFDVQILSATKSKRPAKTKTTIDDDGSEAQVDASENAIVSPSPAPAPEPEPDKTVKEIQDEIAALFRQITASVTFLPQLQGDCTFNVLVYADANSEVPVEWGDSDAKEIVNGEKVQLRGFSTINHRVDTMVSYRMVE